MLLVIMLNLFSRGHDNVSLWLCWNVVPFAGGQLQIIKSQREHLVLPQQYARM